jgi:hypothetical protein
MSKITRVGQVQPKAGETERNAMSRFPIENVGATRPADAPNKIPMALILNDVQRQPTITPWTTLLDALRGRLNLIKKGSDHPLRQAASIRIITR